MCCTYSWMLIGPWGIVPPIRLPMNWLRKLHTSCTTLHQHCPTQFRTIDPNLSKYRNTKVSPSANTHLSINYPYVCRQLFNLLSSDVWLVLDKFQNFSRPSSHFQRQFKDFPSAFKFKAVSRAALNSRTLTNFTPEFECWQTFQNFFWKSKIHGLVKVNAGGFTWHPIFTLKDRFCSVLH